MVLEKFAPRLNFKIQCTHQDHNLFVKFTCKISPPPMRTHKAQKTVSLKKQIGIDIYWETVGQNEI